MSSRSRLTVGSLRGVPQGAQPFTPKRGVQPVTPSRPKGCCGSGCATCPYGRILRVRMGLPVILEP